MNSDEAAILIETRLTSWQNKALDNVKSEAGSKNTSAAPSRASSVTSTKSATNAKSKSKGKKK